MKSIPKESSPSEMNQTSCGWCLCLLADCITNTKEGWDIHFCEKCISRKISLRYVWVTRFFVAFQVAIHSHQGIHYQRNVMCAE